MPKRPDEAPFETHMTALGKRLIAAAKEARAIARGEVDSETYRVHAPADIGAKRIRLEKSCSKSDTSDDRS
jgi:putative transcriptional regulator